MNAVFQRVLLMAGLFWCVTGCTKSEPVVALKDGTTRVKLALNWFPECEHGGFIAGDVHGHFSARDLDVEIIPGAVGAPQQVIADLASGRILFAVSDADNVVKARSRGAKLVAVMAAMQNSPRCIMVHEGAGIERLEDLANLELAISESRPFALWMKRKLPLTNVTMIPFSGSVAEFLTKPKFAQQAYVFSEPFVAREKGGDPKTLMVSDLGFNPYASLLVTTEEAIQTQPDLVKQVVDGCLEGWQTYLQDATQTNQAIHSMNDGMSIAALEFGVSAMRPLCLPEESTKLGEMSLTRWQTLVSQIEEVGEIEAGSVKAEDCFSTKFLPESGEK
ncbi:MAG: ABC transporter substrate-binding protein [Planctomycetaceae bacterium]